MAIAYYYTPAVTAWAARCQARTAFGRVMASAFSG
jgi:glutathione S-transferase